MKVDICDRNKTCFLIFSPKISAIPAKFQQFLRRFPEFVHFHMRILGIFFTSLGPPGEG